MSAELLGSRLQEKNLLSPGTTFAWYRHRESEFLPFFNMDESLVYCSNIQGLVSQMGQLYDASQWRLFIDSSKRSLKAVLLNNGNDLASIPVAHSVQMHESYDNLKCLLAALKYDEHNWLLCGDLKVIAILLEHVGGSGKIGLNVPN